MNVKGKIQGDHEASAGFHRATAQKHGSLAKTHSAAEKSHMALHKCFAKADGMEEVARHHGDMSEHHGLMSEHHASLSKYHADEGDRHAAEAKTMKAAVAADLNKLQPDHFTSTIPSDVPASGFGGFGITAVPRHGAPSMSALDKVAPQFRHLLSNLDDEV